MGYLSSGTRAKASRSLSSKNIISRKEAKAAGLMKFFTGNMCHRGHLDYRYVPDGDCLPCRVMRRSSNEYKDGQRKYNRQYGKTRDRTKSDDELQKQREYNKRYYAENIDKEKDRIRTYREKTPNWRDYRNAAKESALYNASKAKRVVSWADQDAIDFFYECCPAVCQVDHIIPLHGENISGLHVETNLQWLTDKQNQSKNNHWPHLLSQGQG